MTRALLTVLDETNPNKLADAMKELPVGRAFNLAPKFYRGAVASNVLVLPAGAKAIGIIYALATAGTTAGYQDILPTSATLATGQCKVDAKGDIVFFATDAVTAAEVSYVTVEGDLVTRDITVVPGTGIGVLPDTGIVLLSATSLTGTLVAAMTVLSRTATAPATGNARLDLNGTQVRFAVADAVTTARVTYLKVPTRTVDAALRAQVAY